MLTKHNKKNCKLVPTPMKLTFKLKTMHLAKTSLAVFCMQQ